MTTRALSGKPKGKPRGRPWPKGVCANPGGKPKADGVMHGEVKRRKMDMDARLFAREHGIEAVRKLVTIMRSRSATHNAQLIAAIGLLDRGWGRPPQALEIFGGDVRPEERAGSALEIIESKLAELGRRIREAEGPKLIN